MGPTSHRRSTVLVAAIGALCSSLPAAVAAHAASASGSAAAPLQVAVSIATTAAVARSSTSMASANFDWHKNTEEVPAWVNCSVLRTQLDNPRLLAAAGALGTGAPTHGKEGGVLRIGGSEGDSIYYDTTGAGCPASWDPDFCLNMTKWEAMVEFASTTGMRIVFGLNAMNGRKSKTQQLNFTNIEALLNYTAAHKMDVYGFELGNELTDKVEPHVLGVDFVTLHGLLGKYWPDKSSRPLLIGPDENPNPPFMKSFLEEAGSVMDAVTIHDYTGYGLDPNLAANIPETKFLDTAPSKAEELSALMNQYAPQAEHWVGEIAAAWHSGRDNVTNAFESSLWYADNMAAFALQNYTKFCRQTLHGGWYGLLNLTTYEPNPDLWTATLYHMTLGHTVLKATSNETSVRTYAHCTPGASSGSDGGAVAMLVVNINNQSAAALDVTWATTRPEAEASALPHAAGSTRDEYILTAPNTDLASRVMLLNGKPLALTSKGEMPSINPNTVSASSPLVVPSLSIAFVVFPDAGAHACS